MAVVAVFIAALNLRAGISSLGPVLGEMSAAFHVGGAVAGALTAMPGFFFAVMGLVAVPIAARLGLTRTIFGGMVACLVGLAVRPWVGGISWFVLLTAIVVAGIALGNVLIPAWIKHHGGRRVVLLMTVYSSILGLSGAIGPLSALPFAGGPQGASNGWRWALMVWAFTALAQVLVWCVVALRSGFDFPDYSAGAKGAGPRRAGTDEGADRGSEAGVAGKSTESVPLRNAPTAVYLALFFGLQSMQAYVQFGWLPKMYTDSGVSAGTASIALALIGGLGVVGGVVMPALISRSHSIASMVVLFAVLTVAGYLGLLLAPAAAPLLWACLLAVGGFCFPTAIALIPARTRSPLVTARLSGFVQPMGYFIAAAGPLLVGVMYGLVGSFGPILVALIVSAVAMGAVGARAARHVMIDDELAAA